MTRRDLLISLLQAFFLALFPWLRSERGVEALHETLDASLPQNVQALFKTGTFQISFGVKGYELSPETWDALRDNDVFAREEKT